MCPKQNKKEITFQKRYVLKSLKWGLKELDGYLKKA